MRTSFVKHLGGLLLLVLLTYPMFFDIYRNMAFNTAPHDDYAPYLLYLLGEPGGTPASAPFGYRILSVAIAAPFYYLLPTYRFHNLPEKSLSYLRAQEALSMLAYLAIVMTALLIFKLIRDKLDGTTCYAAIGALLSVLLVRFIGLYGIDPVAIMCICLLLSVLERPKIFVCLILCSVGFNEKIFLLFAMLLSARFLFVSRKISIPFVATIAALISYFSGRIIIPLPGNEGQLHVLRYPSRILDGLFLSVSTKGIFLNLLPVLLVFSLYILAVKGGKNSFEKNPLHCSKVDIVPLLGIIGIALAVDVKYNVGRIAMHCFPLYLPGCMKYIEGLEKCFLDKEREML